MPFRPPAGSWVWFSSVGRVSVKKVDIIKSRQGGLRAVRVVGSLHEVDLHKVPAWANGAGGGICDKKEAVGGCKDGGVQLRWGQ